MRRRCNVARNSEQTAAPLALRRFKLAPRLSKEELKHWLLPRPGVSGRRRRALCVALLNVPPPRAPSPRAFRLCAARR